MGILIDGNVAGSDQHGTELAKQQAIEEKYAWQQDRGWQNNPTLGVWRYTVTGRDEAAHIAGTRTRVTSVGGVPLTTVSCTVDDYAKEYEHKWGGVAKAGDKIFVVYDVEVLVDDRVDFDEEKYEPKMVDYDADSGRCEFLARVVADS